MMEHLKAQIESSFLRANINTLEDVCKMVDAVEQTAKGDEASSGGQCQTSSIDIVNYECPFPCLQAMVSNLDQALPGQLSNRPGAEATNQGQPIEEALSGSFAIADYPDTDPQKYWWAATNISTRGLNAVSSKPYLNPQVIEDADALSECIPVPLWQGLNQPAESSPVTLSPEMLLERDQTLLESANRSLIKGCQVHPNPIRQETRGSSPSAQLPGNAMSGNTYNGCDVWCMGFDVWDAFMNDFEEPMTDRLFRLGEDESLSSSNK